MEAFVLVILASVFIVTCIMLFYSVKWAMVDEDPLYYIGASIFIIILIALTFLSYEFNNYIGGIL